MLKKWVVYQIYGSTLPKQGKVKLEIILSYFSLKLYHIDRHLSIDAVLARYLAQVFLRFVLSTIRIVVVGDSIYQIYTRGQNTTYCMTRPLIAMIALHFLKILTKRLCGYCWQGGLTFHWLGLVFFFWRLEEFFFLVKLPAFPTISIYFSKTGRRLERSFRFGLDGFIEHFILKVQFLVPTISLSLDRRP